MNQRKGGNRSEGRDRKAGLKSKAEEMRSQLFRRHGPQHGKEMEPLLGAKPTDVLIDLQKMREDVCVEIEGMLRRLDKDEMDEDEIKTLNEEANRKFQLRWTIEDDIYAATRGAQDFVFRGDRKKFRYFGQAKKLATGGEATDITIDMKAVLKAAPVKEAAEETQAQVIAKVLSERPAKKRKRALFEDSSEAE